MKAADDQVKAKEQADAGPIRPGGEMVTTAVHVPKTTLSLLRRVAVARADKHGGCQVASSWSCGMPEPSVRSTPDAAGVFGQQEASMQGPQDARKRAAAPCKATPGLAHRGGGCGVCATPSGNIVPTPPQNATRRSPAALWYCKRQVRAVQPSGRSQAVIVGLPGPTSSTPGNRLPSTAISPEVTR